MNQIAPHATTADTFTRIVRDAPFGIYVLNSDFRLIEISAGCQKVFTGIDPLMGRDFSEIIRTIWQEPFGTECIGYFRRTLETGEPYRASDTGLF